MIRRFIDIVVTIAIMVVVVFAIMNRDKITTIIEKKSTEQPTELSDSNTDDAESEVENEAEESEVEVADIE